MDLGTDHEILLADGASNDETLQIASEMPNLKVVSRADSGIYDGMNRCLTAATGDIVHILNSDDQLLPGALDSALEVFSQRPEIDSVSGDALFGTSIDGAIKRTQRGALKTSGVFFGVPAINARFFRLRTMRAVGKFRTDIGLGADREWLLRLAARGQRGLALGRPVYFYRQHRGSCTIAGTLDSHLRVYRSDIQLANAVLADGERQSQRTRTLARAFKSVARTKIRLTEEAKKSRGSSARQPPIKITELSRGVALWAKWRGVLSGF